MTVYGREWEMPDVLTRVDGGDTYCGAFGHRWMLMKCYGNSYMECEVCKRVREIDEQDALEHFRRQREQTVEWLRDKAEQA